MTKFTPPQDRMPEKVIALQAELAQVRAQLERECEAKHVARAERDAERLAVNDALGVIERLKQELVRERYELSVARGFAGESARLREGLRYIWAIAEASEGVRMRTIERKAAALIEPEDIPYSDRELDRELDRRREDDEQRDAEYEKRKWDR